MDPNPETDGRKRDNEGDRENRICLCPPEFINSARKAFFLYQHFPRVIRTFRGGVLLSSGGLKQENRGSVVPQ